MTPIPFFRFPTTVVCVDDDPEFLKILAHSLEKQFRVKTFTDPLEAIGYINSKAASPISQIPFLKSVDAHEHYDNIHHLPVDFDINEITKLARLENKYDEVAVVILDQNMPGIKGTEVCQKLNNKEIKKILLTGEFDHADAIQAFNDRLIDCFVQKGPKNLNLLESLRAYIDIQEQQYFSAKTANLHNYLTADRGLPLSDSTFTQLFNRWCKHHHIKEFYLIDRNGNYLLIDKDGKEYYFIIYTDEALDEFIEPYEDDEDLADCINSIRARQSIPFFGVNVNPDKVNPENWPQYLHNPQVIFGTSNKVKFYWLSMPVAKEMLR